MTETEINDLIIERQRVLNRINELKLGGYGLDVLNSMGGVISEITEILSSSKLADIYDEYFDGLENAELILYGLEKELLS